MTSLIKEALVTFLLSVSTTNANIFPTNPDGGAAIFTPNQKVSIEWKDDGKAPNLKALGVVLVEFMTGADLDQVPLEPIGKVPATVGKIAWVVPEVDPPGKFYFLRFSNGKVDDVYTTRFTITDKNGKYPAETIPPPAVGKNLGKVGKIVAKGDPNGPVPKEIGVENSNETPKQPAKPADDTLKEPKNAKKTPNNDAKAPDNSAKTDNPTPTNNIFPSAFVSGNNNTITTTSSAFSINYNIDIIGVLTFISLLSSMII
ncbi:hypothetical protein C1646_742450 [Rhizophagus diaphanus]|nr:hypothetical protein C1646_742450 [Rhizophagus diaphanus] [Rhizophagus sp. MUCL 43196]